MPWSIKGKEVEDVFERKVGGGPYEVRERKWLRVKGSNSEVM